MIGLITEKVALVCGDCESKLKPMEKTKLD